MPRFRSRLRLASLMSMLGLVFWLSTLDSGASDDTASEKPSRKYAQQLGSLFENSWRFSLKKNASSNLNNADSDQGSFSSESAANSTASFSSRFHPWCDREECSNGRWVPLDPPFRSLADFQAAYANRLDHVWKGCRAIPRKTEEGAPVDQKKVDEDRLMDVMSWAWRPYVGEMRKWDVDEFAIRLLRSPGGLILIGDSITQQHHHALGYALNQGDLEFDVDPPHLPMHDHKNVHQRVLKPHSPKTRELLRRAGVPESRLQRPILTMLEDHMLIGQRDIRAITNAREDYYWYHDFQRVPGWEEFVKNATMQREGEEDTVTEDTVLVMNAGAHWSRHELAMLPARPTDEEEQAQVVATYQKMTKLITDRIAPIDHLLVYYRSTSPGHPICEARSKPYLSPHEALDAEQRPVERLKSQVDTPDLKRQRARWDWDLFQPHNAVWRRLIEDELAPTRRTRVQAGLRPGARWEYVDLWQLDLQRPDAHSEPGIDCLHWCLPSVLNQWTAHIHHLLFLDSISRDE